MLPESCTATARTWNHVNEWTPSHANQLEAALRVGLAPAKATHEFPYKHATWQSRFCTTTIQILPSVFSITHPYTRTVCGPAHPAGTRLV